MQPEEPPPPRRGPPLLRRRHGGGALKPVELLKHRIDTPLVAAGNMVLAAVGRRLLRRSIRVAWQRELWAGVSAYDGVISTSLPKRGRRRRSAEPEAGLSWGFLSCGSAQHWVSRGLAQLGHEEVGGDELAVASASEEGDKEGGNSSMTSASAPISINDVRNMAARKRAEQLQVPASHELTCCVLTTFEDF